MDPSGQFTYASHLGKSIIDLAIVNLAALNLIKDFQVILTPESDHFPICIFLYKGELTNLAGSPYTQSIWKNTLKKTQISIKCAPHLSHMLECDEDTFFEELLNNLHSFLED